MSLVSQFLSHNERCTHHFTDANSKCVLSSSLVVLSYVAWKQKCNTLKQWIYCRHPIISMYVGRRMRRIWFTFMYYTLLFLRFKTLFKPANPFFSCTMSSLKHAYFKSTRICDVTPVSILCLDFVHYPHLNDIKRH